VHVGWYCKTGDVLECHSSIQSPIVTPEEHSPRESITSATPRVANAIARAASTAWQFLSLLSIDC
jgi:hypothetical protein